MMQLYEPTATDFTLNGHVLTDVYNDTVNWEMNKVFELTFDYPLFSPHGSQLTKEMIVTVPVPSTHNHDQGFRINSVTKSMGIVTVHAYHLFWDLNQNFIEDINNVNSTGAEAAQHIIDNTQYPNNFKVSSDLANTANARMVRMSAISALIGDDDNSFITRWGGEFEWDNFTINIASTIGENRGVEFRNGKNLTGYTAEENMDSVVTRIMPIGYDGLLLPEKYIDSSLIDNYTEPRIALIEYSDIKAIDPDSTSTDEDAVPLDEAYVKLRAAAKDEFDTNHLDKPTTTIKLNVVLLENTEEYKGLEQFNKVYPGDTARFVHTDDDVDTTAELTGYTWSPTQQSYLTVTFESATKSAPTFSQTISRVTNSVQSIGKDIKLVSANGQNANTYSQHEPTDSDPGVEGEVWYENDGSSVNMWIFTNGHWKEEIHDATGEEIKQSVDAQFQGVATWRASIDSDLAIVKAKNEQFDASVQSLSTDIATLKSDVTKSVADASDKAQSAIDNANAVKLTAEKALESADGANNSITEINTTVDDLKGTMATKADSSSIDAANGRIETLNSQVWQNSQDIKLSAKATDVNTLTGRVTTAEGLITTNANQIKNAVTKTELTTAKSEWSSAQSTITAGQISTEITKVNQTITNATKNLISQTVLNNAIVSSETGTKQVISESIANISVGGRNYLPETSFETITNWNAPNALHQMSIDSDNKLNGNNSLRITASAPVGGGDVDLIYTGFYGSHSKGDVFKLSFWAKSISGNTSLHTELYGGIGATNVTITTEWERYVVNLTYSNVMVFYFWLNGAGVCLINSPKLESGTQVTDWSPAPEDQASVTAVNTIEQTFEGMKQTIANSTGDISTVKNTAQQATLAITDANKNITTLNATVNGMQTTVANAATKSSVTQLANQLTSTVGMGDNLMIGGDYENETVGQQSQYWNENGTVVQNQSNSADNKSTNVMQIIGSTTNNVDSTSNVLIPVEQQEYFYSIDTRWSNVTQINSIIGYVFEFDGSKNLISPFPVIHDSTPADWTTHTGLYTPTSAKVKYVKLDITLQQQYTTEPVFFDNVIFRVNNVTQTQLTQTQSMIDLRVEKSGLLSEINMQAGATIVKSNKLYLDASSVIMGGTAFINAANIKTVSASSITAGTLNASLVNVVNLSASSIVAGVLSGAGIVMNLGTGEVNFQRGSIHSSDNQLYIDMDSKVISTSSVDASAILKNGELQLTEPNFFDLSDDPYFRLYHGSFGSSIGAVIEGRGGIAIAEAGSNLGIITASGWGKSDFAGIAIRDGQTFVGSNATRLYLRGGNNASIEIGDTFSSSIDRVVLNGKQIYLRSTETWPTTSNSSNMYRSVDGRLLDVTSASKYKIDIKRTHSMEMAEKLIQLPVATWIDKAEQVDFENGNTATKPTRNFGMIAEDLDEAGLEELVVKHDGEVEGLQYDRIALTLIPLIKDMKEQIDLLKLKVEELTNAS